MIKKITLWASGIGTAIFGLVIASAASAQTIPAGALAVPTSTVTDHREDSPMQGIISLVQDSEVPDGSTRYKGYDNKIFNKIIEAIQIAAE